MDVFLHLLEVDFEVFWHDSTPVSSDVVSSNPLTYDVERFHLLKLSSAKWYRHPFHHPIRQVSEADVELIHSVPGPPRSTQQDFAV